MIFLAYLRPIFLVITLIVTSVSTAKQKAKTVTTLIEAKWEVTPVVLEIAEYIGDESINDYWSFIDDISNLKPDLIELSSDKQQYEKALEVINFYFEQLSNFYRNFIDGLFYFRLQAIIYLPFS